MNTPDRFKPEELRVGDMMEIANTLSLLQGMVATYASVLLHEGTDSEEAEEALKEATQKAVHLEEWTVPALYALDLIETAYTAVFGALQATRSESPS